MRTLRHHPGGGACGSGLKENRPVWRQIFAALNAKRRELERTGSQGKILTSRLVPPVSNPPHRVVGRRCERAPKTLPAGGALHDKDELLQAVCDYYRTRFGVEHHALLVMSCRGTQEVWSRVPALADPVTWLLSDPCYPVFATGTLLGAKAWYYPLTAEHDFLPWVEGIPKDDKGRRPLHSGLASREPVGSVGTPGCTSDRRLCRSSLSWSSDNAYSDIIFDGPTGRASSTTQIALDVGVSSSTLKSFNVTGARLSFLVGREDIVAATRANS